MRAQLEKILQKFIRSHTICKGTTWCNCRLSTKPSQLKLQVEEHLPHSSYTALKMSAVSPFSLIYGVFHLGLANCCNCCGSLSGRLMGSWEQRFQQLPCCPLKSFDMELPNTNKVVAAVLPPLPQAHSDRCLEISHFPALHFERECRKEIKVINPWNPRFMTVHTS